MNNPNSVGKTVLAKLNSDVRRNQGRKTKMVVPGSLYCQREMLSVGFPWGPNDCHMGCAEASYFTGLTDYSIKLRCIWTGWKDSKPELVKILSY